MSVSMKKRTRVALVVALALLILVPALLLQLGGAVHNPGFLSFLDVEVAKAATSRDYTELVDRRTESSKTYSLGGNSYAIEATIGVIHYKNDRSDPYETWKDINTEISPDGTVNSAPYDLQVYLTGLPGFHYVSKESGEFDVRMDEARVSSTNIRKVNYDHKVKPVIDGNTVTWPDLYPDVDVVLTASNTGVSLNRIIKSASAPLEYDVTVTEIEKGVAQLMPIKPAIDAEGQLIKMEEKPTFDGRTETLKLEVVEDEDSKAKPIKYPIKDATIIDVQVTANANDGCAKSNNSLYQDIMIIGSAESDRYWNSYALLELGEWIGGANFTSAYISTYLDDSDDSDNFLSRIYLNKVEDPSTPTDNTDLEGKALTTAYVDVNTPPGSGWQNSPSLVDLFNELATAYNTQTVQILWKDNGSDQTGGAFYKCKDYNDDSDLALKLHLEFTGGGVPPVEDSLSIVQKKTGEASSDAISITLDDATTEGNFLVVVWGAVGGASSPSLGGDWHDIIDQEFTSESGAWGYAAWMEITDALEDSVTIPDVDAGSGKADIAALFEIKALGGNGIEIGDVQYNDIGGTGTTIVMPTTAGLENDLMIAVGMFHDDDMESCSWSEGFEQEIYEEKDTSTDGTLVVATLYTSGADDYDTTATLTSGSNDQRHAFMFAIHEIAGGGEPSLANTPSSENLGNVDESSTYYAYGSAPSNPVEDGECTFTITNDGSISIDIDVKATNFTGGGGWTLTSGSPGSDTVRMTAYYSGQNPASGVVLTTGDQAFYTGLASSATLKWDFKLETGTFSDGDAKTSTITLSASAA